MQTIDVTKKQIFTGFFFFSLEYAIDGHEYAQQLEWKIFLSNIKNKGGKSGKNLVD